MEQTPIPNATKPGRGKYFTLAVLVVWVIGVFVFTLVKYTGSK